MKCPKCGLAQADSNEECLRCGVIFSKIGAHAGSEITCDHRSSAPKSIAEARERDRCDVRDRERGRRGQMGLRQSGGRVARTSASGEASRLSEHAAPLLGDPVDEELRFSEVADENDDARPEARSMDKEDWLVVGGGLIAAVIVLSIPLLNHIFLTFVVLIHEMGHFLTGWIFAYPSAPAFDLQYGGGVTIHGQRSLMLLMSMYLLAGFLVYSFRKNVGTVILLVSLLVVHAILSATFMHEVVILSMGHGTELIIAAVFFYRALSGAAVVHSVERPLYAAVSFFVVFTDLRFAYRLMTSTEARFEYEQAKGGGHWMDFSRIAEDYLHVELTSVAFFFFLATMLPLVAGFLLFRYQDYVRRWIQSRWSRDPSEA